MAAEEEGCPLSRGWEKRIAAKAAAAGDGIGMYIAWHAATQGNVCPTMTRIWQMYG